MRPVQARYVRHSQMWPQLDVSEKNKNTFKICSTDGDVSDKNENKTQDVSDKITTTKRFEWC